MTDQSEQQDALDFQSQKFLGCKDLRYRDNMSMLWLALCLSKSIQQRMQQATAFLGEKTNEREQRKRSMLTTKRTTYYLDEAWIMESKSTSTRKGTSFDATFKWMPSKC